MNRSSFLKTLAGIATIPFATKALSQPAPEPYEKPKIQEKNDSLPEYVVEIKSWRPNESVIGSLTVKNRKSRWKTIAEVNDHYKVCKS